MRELVVLDKIKRPGGTFWWELLSVGEDDDGVWLYAPTGARWVAPHDEGTMPFDALLLLRASPACPSVTWWVDDPSDHRVEIDVCLQPARTERGWSYVDLELDPVRHEDGSIEVEDRDEFDEGRRDGWIDDGEAAAALRHAAELERSLRERREPWGDQGWGRLRALQRAR